MRRMTALPLTNIKNWAGQYSCTPRRIHRASCRDDVITALAAAAASNSRLRVLGAACSPSDIAMSDEDLLILDGMSRIVTIDKTARRVRVEAGARLADITAAIALHRLAFPVLGSISNQTIAGAISTSTHGTGVDFGSLSSLVDEIELVTPGGEILQLSATRHPEVFNAARCGLGAIGVITEVTLRLAPAFDLIVSEEPSDLDTVLSALPERLTYDHFRFWYLPHAERVWEWKATRTKPSEDSTPSPRLSLPLWWRERAVGVHAYEALLYVCSFAPTLVSMVNRWYAQLLFGVPRKSRRGSDRQFNFNCLFAQHVNEWAIPIERTGEALRGLRDLIARNGFCVHMPIEVRFVKGDDIWLSPCHERDSCYIGVIAYMPFGRNTTDHVAYFAAFEALMASLDGRPHWAKCFGPDAAWLQDRYPRWTDFQRIRAKHDPQGRLTNSYTDRVLGPVWSTHTPGAR